MPQLRRSPPRAEPEKSNLAHCMSDPNLKKALDGLTVPQLSSEHGHSEPNLAVRKRKRGSPDDLISEERVVEMFKQLRKEQDMKFEALMNKVQSGFNTNTEQNTQITSSIDFLAQKYDEALARIKTLEDEKTSDRKYIKTLETRLEALDRSLQTSSIEVRNVPKKSGETKEDLLKIVQSVGTAVSVPFAAKEVQDVYRIHTKNENNQPIVARLSTVLLRDKIVSTVKAFNKKFASNKLNTSNLKLAGPPKPVYVSESLTVQAKKLFYLAREFAKGNDYKYCWAARGKVYLRKSDGAQLVKINDESEMEALKSK